MMRVLAATLMALVLSAMSQGCGPVARDDHRAFLEAAMVDDQLVLPYAKQGLSDVYENTRVLSENYGTSGRIIKVRGLPGAIARLRRTLGAL